MGWHGGWQLEQKREHITSLAKKYKHRKADSNNNLGRPEVGNFSLLCDSYSTKTSCAFFRVPAPLVTTQQSHVLGFRTFRKYACGSPRASRASRPASRAGAAGAAGASGAGEPRKNVGKVVGQLEKQTGTEMNWNQIKSNQTKISRTFQNAPIEQCRNDPSSVEILYLLNHRQIVFWTLGSPGLRFALAKLDGL